MRFAPETQIDVGGRLETAVYVYARREREDLAYVGGTREIDLGVGAEQAQVLFNVALSVTDDATWRRETDALQWAGQAIPGARRVVVTHEQGGRGAPQGIEGVDARRYLLGRQ